MENSSLSRLCLESISDNMAMWCECAAKEDFYKYLYVIGPFNNLSKFYILMPELVYVLLASKFHSTSEYFTNGFQGSLKGLLRASIISIFTLFYIS